MSIWHYSERQRGLEPSLWPFATSQSQIYNCDSWKQHLCFYCNEPMRLLYNEDRLEAEYRNAPGDHEHSKTAHACPVCGWWRVLITRWHAYAGVSHFQYASVGVLKNLSLTDITLPVQEVRDFLAAKYSERFDVHPRLFEQTVGSVFRDLGYDVRVTSYSKDGGIDAILDRESETIGVQVKRTKRIIEVEQIIALTGALVSKSLKDGMFVTTSSYRSGAIDADEQYKTKDYRVELLDGDRFFDALKIAQINMYSGREEFESLVHVEESDLETITADKI